MWRAPRHAPQSDARCDKCSRGTARDSIWQSRLELRAANANQNQASSYVQRSEQICKESEYSTRNPFSAVLVYTQVGARCLVFRAVLTARYDPRAPVQSLSLSLWGAGGTGCPPEVPRPPLGPFQRSGIRRPNAGPCRAGGLSSTDERVMGHVTEVTHRQALRNSPKQMVPASPTRPGM